MITVPLSFDDIAQCYYIVRKQALLHRPWFAKHFSSVPGLEQHQHPPGGHGRCALTWMHRGPCESSSVWAETGAPVSPTPWPIREEVKDKAFHWANGSWIIVKRLVHHIINFFFMVFTCPAHEPQSTQEAAATKTPAHSLRTSPCWKKLKQKGFSVILARRVCVLDFWCMQCVLAPLAPCR